MPTLSASALCICFFFFSEYPSSLHLHHATCPSEFSSDTYSPGSFSASYAQLRIGASPECSILLTSGFQLHSGRRSEGGSRVRSAYLFPTPSLLGHRRLTVSSIHSHNSCQAPLLHTGLLLGPNCSLRFALQTERGVMPPPGSWPQSTKVLFLHLAHICVNSPFINCPQLPSLRCPLFPAATIPDP